MSGRLYVVGTPIGNLEDFSVRARRTLEEADFIAAEDTRVTLRLLNHFGIKKEMLSYYEHNKRDKGNLIIERIMKGESCALVSDAGMPAISDPGEDLVRAARGAGIAVEAVPGPCALVTALAVSGMPSGRFCFEGFLSVNKISRRKHLEELKGEKRTMIFYEAPHKLAAALKDMLCAFGDRRIALARELTKIHESVISTTLSEAASYYESHEPKGECVLVIEGMSREAIEQEEKEKWADMSIEEHMEHYLSQGFDRKEAMKKTAKDRGVPKREIYNYLEKEKS